MFFEKIDQIEQLTSLDSFNRKINYAITILTQLLLEKDSDKKESRGKLEEKEEAEDVEIPLVEDESLLEEQRLKTLFALWFTESRVEHVSRPPDLVIPTAPFLGASVKGAKGNPGSSCSFSN